DRHLPFLRFRAQICGYATGSVSGDFSFRSIGIDQPGADIGVLRRKKPLHTIGPDSLMAVANMLAETCNISGQVHAIDNEEVITAGACLNKRNSRRRTHSCSVAPRDLTVVKAADLCSCASNASSSRCTHLTENATRALPFADTALTSSIASSSLSMMSLSSLRMVSVLLPLTSKLKRIDLSENLPSNRPITAKEIRI